MISFLMMVVRSVDDNLAALNIAGEAGQSIHPFMHKTLDRFGPGCIVKDNLCGEWHR